ncbi:CBU_0592 family membrane protein [Thetidibacter halocola]|uniref:CBU-0592-like domain-containing protein n=1 Tax=Thetidibacter halocola TaxID=2827239 RepID=A0A8J8B6Z2_9RHOB|nr:hypothetical protein [Thetidibacter halocola]MBS0124561.1 hypothetical protein [Thetidibacter halocola]
MTVFYSFPDFYTFIGVIGACTYITNYTALSFRRVDPDSILYFSINSCAAFCVMTSMLAQMNLPSLMIQSFYLTVSLMAVVLRLLRRRREPDRGWSGRMRTERR